MKFSEIVEEFSDDTGFQRAVKTWYAKRKPIEYITKWFNKSYPDISYDIEDVSVPNGYNCKIVSSTHNTLCMSYSEYTGNDSDIDDEIDDDDDSDDDDDDDFKKRYVEVTIVADGTPGCCFGVHDVIVHNY
jgi:hypothetical protein